MLVLTSRSSSVLAESLADRKVEGVIARQMVRPVAIQKSRAIVECPATANIRQGRSPSMPAESVLR